MKETVLEKLVNDQYLTDAAFPAVVSFRDKLRKF